MSPLRAPFRLSWKLMLAIVPAVSLVVGLVAWLGYSASRREILAAIDREARLLAQRTASNIDELLAQRYRDLFTLAETPLIADYYRNVEFGLSDEAQAYRKELQRYFAGFASRTKVYAAILYLDASGREVARAGDAPPPSKEFIEELRASGDWRTSRVQLLGDGRHVLHYGKPIRDELGRTKGFLVLDYDLEEAKALLRSIVVGSRGRAYAVTASGVRFQGKPPTGVEGDLLTASATLRRRPWTVWVEAPQEDFLGPLRSVQRAAALTCLLGLAGLIAALLLLVRSITRPIAALAAAARRVEAGDMSTRVDSPGGDELGELAAAFNAMATRLEQDRRLKGELQAQLIQAEKLSAIGQLISAVAHELNNPLGAASAFAQMAARDPKAPETLREDLGRIRFNIMRCQKVVDNLLFFARQSRQERKRVDLNEAASSALELLQYRLQKNEDVRVEAALDPDPPLAAGDFQQIVQVLVNLISNACDAMGEVSRYPEHKRLVLRTGRSETASWVEVADNGPGIPESLGPRLFEPFFTTKESGRGTGLGLSISRSIAKEHGGDLTFSSVAGEGSSFRLSLPSARPEDLEQLEESAPPPEFSPVPGKRVLVADDEADIAELISRVLREDGDEPVSVTSGTEALELVRTEAFDLVVSDMAMEGVRGSDLYTALAQRVSPRHPRILFVTGDILNAKVLEFFSRTNAEYLVKPFDVTELRQTLRRLLAQGAP